MPDTASRLLLLACVVRSLPGREQFEGFAGAALSEVPGVAEARVVAQPPLKPPPLPTGWERLPLSSGTETFGFVDLRITQPETFERHAGDVRNAVNLLALELERRAALECLQEAHETLRRQVAEDEEMSDLPAMIEQRLWRTG